MRLCSAAQCALTILYIKFKELSKLELSITIYINSMSHTRYIRIIAMMYACNSLPPWRAGIPRASFSSLQQPRHAAVEPVQQHHQDMLYILGKIAMKRLRLGWVSVFSWSCSCLHHCIRSLRLHCIHHFANQLRAHQQTADISENIHIFGPIAIAARVNAMMLLDRNKDFHIWLVGVSLYQNFDEYLKHQSIFHCLRLKRKSIRPTPHFNALQIMRKTLTQQAWS